MQEVPDVGNKQQPNMKTHRQLKSFGTILEFFSKLIGYISISDIYHKIDENYRVQTSSGATC